MDQGLHRSEIARQPARVGACRIGVRFARDFHDADDGHFLLAVIKKNRVAQPHSGKVFPGCGTADAAQRERAAFDDLRPGRAEGREFHEPKLLACLHVLSLFCCCQLIRHVLKELRPRFGGGAIFQPPRENSLNFDLHSPMEVT